MTKEDLYIAIECTSSSLAFFTLFFSIKSRRNIPRYIRPIFILLVVNTITEALVLLGLSPYTQINPMTVMKYFTAIEFTLISTFYGMFFGRYFNSIVFYLAIPFFFSLNIIEYKIMGQGYSDNLSVSIESICFILYSLFFLYYVLKNLLFENLLTETVFWINTGILFYFAGNFFLFAFGTSVLLQDPMESALLWATIHTFFNFIYNLFLTIGFWKARVKSI